MARGSASNVVESKTRSKKGAPIKEKNSKKAPTAVVEKTATMRKSEKSTHIKKGVTKMASEVKVNTVAENEEEKRKTGATAIKAGSKKSEKEISKKIEKGEVFTTKSEKTGRKRKMEGDEIINKTNENESVEKVEDMQPIKKKTKTNLCSNVAENIAIKITKNITVNKKSEKITNLKVPVRKARNLKKGVSESELNDEKDLQKRDETKWKKAKAELTQDTNFKKTSVATKSSSKSSEKESDITAERDKKTHIVSQKMRNVKKNVVTANDDKILIMEITNEDESEISESCEIDVSIKGNKKNTEKKTVAKGKKNSNLENSVRKTRNTKKTQDQNSKSFEVENLIQEEENKDIVAETDPSKKNKAVEISGRKTRNAKKTEEANNEMVSEKFDKNSEQVEASNEKYQLLDVGKTRNFKRAGNKKCDAASTNCKVSEISLNENRADAEESQLKTESIVVEETKTKQKLYKKDELDVTFSTRKLKRGAKIVSEENSTEKLQISADEENSNSNLADIAKMAPIRKTRSGGKTIVGEECIQISTEIKDLDEENSNSNLSNMTDSAKTAPTRKTRRGLKTVIDEKSTDEMLISTEIKDLDEENSNSNLSNTADSGKPATIRKTRKRIKNIPDNIPIDQIQISAEIKEILEENSNSNLSNSDDPAKPVVTRKSRRGLKTATADQMQISAEIKRLHQGNSDLNNLLNITDSAATTPTRKTRSVKAFFWGRIK